MLFSGSKLSKRLDLHSNVQVCILRTHVRQEQASSSSPPTPRVLREITLFKTLINPAPVYAYMIQTLVQTWRGWGCSIFIETNVARQSNPLPFKVLSIQQCTLHSTYRAKHNYFKNMIPKRAAACWVTNDPSMKFQCRLTVFHNIIYLAHLHNRTGAF